MNTNVRHKKLFSMERFVRFFTDSIRLISFVVFGLFYGFFFNSVLAQESQVTQSVAPLVADGSAENSKFQTTIALDYETLVANEANQDKRVDLNLTINPAYSLTSKMRLVAKTIVTQHQLNKPSSNKFETEVTDTLISLIGTSLEFPGPTKIAHGLTVIVPTNKTSATVDRLKGAIRVNNGFDTEWNSVSVVYRLGVQRNFHEYNVSAVGSPNIEWALRNVLELTYEFSEKASAKFSGLYIQGRTYGGFEKATYLSDISLTYSYTRSFGLTGGFSNEGSALAANGVDSNLKFYDDKASAWKVGVEVIF